MSEEDVKRLPEGTQEGDIDRFKHRETQIPSKENR